MQTARNLKLLPAARRSWQSLKNVTSKQRRCFCTMERPPIEQSIKSMNDRKAASFPLGAMGQPTPHTHPHLLQPDQLTGGITQEEYMDRRNVLVSKLVADVNNPAINHVIIIPGAVKQFMSDKIPYVFRQNSDFYYLTGCMEPGAVLVLVKEAEDQKYNSVLFVSDKDEHVELWEGPRTGCKAAEEMFAVNEARPVQGVVNYITRVTAKKPCMIWYHHESPANPELSPIVRTILQTENNEYVKGGDPKRTLHLMRAVKSPAEVELMRETCLVGAQALNMAMACTKPGLSEHTLNAVLDFTSRQGGAEQLAFPPVVAGAARATHIHYVANNQLLNDGDLVLVDAGSQRWLYNSDLTRTWPVNGRFTNYQRILYEIVLSTQKRLIQLLGEQRQPLDQLFDQMCRLLGSYLQQEGILSKDLDNHQLINRAYALCPHHVSHYLGLDVHDAPLVTRNVPVRTNMVVTVEPGLYIRADNENVPEEFRGIGIRIEDDVLITDSEPEVLTRSAAKEVDDVEAIVGRHNI